MTTNDPNADNVTESVKRTLDAVSPSFCLAKWHQATIHLQNGTTHSCHHPRAHKIPIDEIKNNPSALHNTHYKLQQRKLMMHGQRPQECDYCWRIEDAPGNNISDRIFKSGFTWSLPHIKEVLDNPLNAHFAPRYLEVNLGSVCNFKCSYCSPEVSTRWMNEIRQYGPYPTSGKHPTLNPQAAPIPEGEPNPYLDAWWKWWPDLYPHLHTFRITGGEPLLNKNFYRILDWIENNPRPDLILAINTNLGPPPDQWEYFLKRLRTICDNNLVKHLEIYTSAEAWGSQAEYIRYGMDFSIWQQRLWQVLETVPSITMTIMATYNALSVTSFDLLLKEVLKIKQTERFYNDARPLPIFLDISYLRYPEHQTVQILTPEFAPFIEKHVEFMQNNAEGFVGTTKKYLRGFKLFETQKMERIKNLFLSTTESGPSSKTKVLRQDFFKFFAEHDRRRKTDFIKTFPEMESFWNLCRDKE